jgi:hypothetical protein
VYELNFESPGYSNGQQIPGAGTISDNINGFSSQALLMQNGGSFDIFAPMSYTEGIHSISWDFGLPSDQAATTILGVSLWDAHVNVTMSGNANNYEILYGPHPPGSPRLSVPFETGQVYSVNVLLDLDLAQYDLFIDGNQLLMSQPLEFGPDSLGYVSLTQNQVIGLEAGFDNFRWEIVPEPSTISLLLVGVVGMLCRRKRRR